MEKLSADALRLALVTASMEYYKKYVEGNQDFDNSEQIKEEIDMETALMITVVIAFVAALIAMLLTIWDCGYKLVKIFLSIAAISTIGMIIVVVIKVMMSV